MRSGPEKTKVGPRTAVMKKGQVYTPSVTTVSTGLRLVRLGAEEAAGDDEDRLDRAQPPIVVHGGGQQRLVQVHVI